MTPSPTTGPLAAAFSLLAVLATACTQSPACPELGTCGGPMPVGEWVLAAGHPSCSEDLYQPPDDTRLIKGDLPPARTPLPEEALYDWCDLLVTNGGKEIAPQLKPRFSYENGSIGAAWVRYDASGNYAAGLTRTGTFVLDFPALCMRQFGAMDGRPADATKDPNTPGVGVCAQMQAQIVSTSAHKNMICVPNPADPAGCLCQFDVSVQSGGSGSYQPRNTSTLIHVLTSSFPGKNQAADFPQDATYCNKGTTLELTGANGQYLFDEPGLRTMDLVATTINCTDGAQGPGEDGVDCGLACPTDCGAAAAPMP